MSINWGRFFVGAIIASIICFVTDGAFHEMLAKDDWKAVYAGLGANLPAENAMSMAYFAVFELGRGFISMLLYVLMRPTCRPGPKTAVWAGVIAWIAYSLTGPAQFVPLHFLSNTLWCKMIALQFVTSIVAALAGAALYKESTGPVVA